MSNSGSGARYDVESYEITLRELERIRRSQEDSAPPVQSP